MNRIKNLVGFIISLINRYPWAIAIFGFVSGVASFFLVEREQEKFAQLVSALMLVSWIWLTLENLLQRSVSSWFGVKLPQPVVSFATQLVHQESLFFVIPFFFFTATWNSGQMVFTSLLIAGAIVSIIDPIYYRWLAARRWLYFIFHGITLFAVLLTALPIIFHLPTPKSYLLSLIIAILLTFPGAIRALPFRWWKRSLVGLVLIAMVGTIGVYVRTWIPPATLRLTDVAITDRIDNETRAPENELRVVTVDQLREGLYAYTAIRAPRGLNERIYHVWRLNGMEVDRIALDINGGREAGYRAWTHKLNFPPYPKGRWQIQVITEADQLIGVLRFQVVDATKNEKGSEATSSAPSTTEARQFTGPDNFGSDMKAAEQEIDSESTANYDSEAKVEPEKIDEPTGISEDKPVGEAINTTVEAETAEDIPLQPEPEVIPSSEEKQAESLPSTDEAIEPTNQKEPD